MKIKMGVLQKNFLDHLYNSVMFFRLSTHGTNSIYVLGSLEDNSLDQNNGFILGPVRSDHDNILTPRYVAYVGHGLHLNMQHQATGETLIL